MEFIGDIIELIHYVRTSIDTILIHHCRIIQPFMPLRNTLCDYIRLIDCMHMLIYMHMLVIRGN
jgi:hypothetical protein